MNESLIKPGHFGKEINNIKVYKNFVELEDLRIIQKFLPTISEGRLDTFTKD